MKRGEVWWADLPNPAGSGPGYRRPVLVVQSNAFNESRVATTLVAVITSNLKLAEAPGNVRISRANSGLDRTSVVNVSQIVTLDRRLLGQKVKRLPATALQRVNEGLKMVLGL